MTTTITGLTRGGKPWQPKFVTAVNHATCIGCGRCYKVCSRDVFDLKEKGEVLGDDFDDEDQDDVAMVMTVSDADDCIGCGACSRVCPKNCHSYS
jgi:Nif-specific ferredoxin III